MMKYLSIDGDNIGDSLEKLILEGNEELLKKTSSAIEHVISETAAYLRSKEFDIIICAGDNLLAKGKNIQLAELKEFISTIQKDTTFSVGVGDSLKEAYLALKYAKVTGKNRIVTYQDNNFKCL